MQTISFNETSRLPRISYAAFANTGIREFKVPAAVETIAQSAFTGSTELTSITFAAGSRLTAIPAYLFQGSDALTAVIFEKGSALTLIEAHGFEGMNSLERVDFGTAALTAIGNYGFRYCPSLRSLVVPDTLETIGRYAFYGCSHLERLDLPAKTEHIGQYAFYGAADLNLYFDSDNLPLFLEENWDEGINGYYIDVSEVLTAGDWQYARLASGNISVIKYTGSETVIDLNALDFGGPIVTIGGYTFYNSAVTNIVLPTTLTNIQPYAFARSQLKSVSIPKTVEFIGKFAFFYTPLTCAEFAADSSLQVMEQRAFAYTRNLTTVSIPASLQTMGSAAFYESGITELTFGPDAVLTAIPELAFAGTKLKSVVMPTGLTQIGSGAFRDNADLRQVTLETDQPLKIMSNAFYNTGLKTVHVPATVEYIGEYAFVDLRQLESFTVAADNQFYSATDGLLYYKAGRKIIAVPAGRTGTVNLPSTVEEIGFGAFENSQATAVIFPADTNILSIGFRAFYGAEKLKDFKVPSSIVSIDYYAFANCKALESIEFAVDSSLTGIYEGAFYGCLNLKNITLPDSIIEISDYAFYGCQSLTDLPISAEIELKGIYDYAFAYTGLETLQIPGTFWI